MSHIVQIQTQVQDATGVAAACRRLGLAAPMQQSVKLFTSTESGPTVKLPGWTYPVVFDDLSRGWRDGHIYHAGFIVGVYLWAPVHDRPVVCACDPINWPTEMKIGKPPSQATMSRRLRSQAVCDLLVLIEDALSLDHGFCRGHRAARDRWQAVGGGGYSKDPEAKYGRAAGGFSNGYKVVAVWGNSAIPVAWDVRSMNVGEVLHAKELVSRLAGTGWIFGDSQFDVNELYEICFQHGFRLIAPRQRPGDLGHSKHSLQRLHSISLMERSPTFRKLFHAIRTNIERKSGNWTSFGSGLAPLPSWVRRLDRVRLWVRAKLCINAATILHRRKIAAA